MTPSDRLDATFAALADPVRRAILGHLASDEVSLAELAERVGKTQPVIAKHLKVLESAGLIARSQDARRQSCRREGGPLVEARHWLDTCDELRGKSPPRLDLQHLDALIDELRTMKKPGPGTTAGVDSRNAARRPARK